MPHYPLLYPMVSQDLPDILNYTQFGIQFSLFRLITENGRTGIRENTAPIGHKKRQKNLGSNAIPAVTNKKRPVPIRLSAIFN